MRQHDRPRIQLFPCPHLRQTLYRLRKAIVDIDDPHPHLLVSPRDIQLNPAGDHWLDVAGFERCLETFRDHCGHGLPLCANCHETLKMGAALYRGEFMARFSLTGSPSFELWLCTQPGYPRAIFTIALTESVKFGFVTLLTIPVIT